MTSRTTEIQTLIADIDSVLTNKRLSKLLSSEGELPRQVLERVRNFLVSCTETEAEVGSPENQEQNQQQRLLSPLLARFVVKNNHSSLSRHKQANQEREDVNSTETNLFSSLLAPLQAEIQGLLQERASLVQEIRQLEQRRLQSYSLAQQLANQEQIITDFLQAVTNRLGGNFQPQKSPTLANSPQEQWLALGAAGSSAANNKGELEQVSSSGEPLLESQDQLARLTRLANELDRRLLALDGSVNVVFESLQRNIHTYNESLSQALARMYSKGLQGEQLLAGLINNFAQQAQLQISSQEPFTIDIHKETLPANLRSLEAGNTISESTQNDTSTAFTSNLPATDSVLSQDNLGTELDQDVQNTPDATHITSHEVEPENSVSIRDEVEQLYASLFGTEIAVNSEIPAEEVNTEVAVDQVTIDETPASNQPTSEFVPQEVIIENTDTLEESSVDETTGNNQQISELFHQEVIVKNTDVPEEFLVDETDTISQQEPEFVPQEVVFEAPNLPDELPSDFLNTVEIQTSDTSDEIQLPDSILSGSDPWFDEPDAGLLDSGNINVINTQDTSEVVREQLLDLSNKMTFAEDTQTSSVSPDEPISVDTTTNVGISQQSSEVELLEISASTAPIPVTEERDIPSEDYVVASPQENLLAQAENQNLAVPEISLDREQLQQLDLDLANFDEQNNLGQQVAKNLEYHEPVEGQLATTFSSTQLAETEKKEDTADSSEIILPSDSNFGNITESKYHNRNSAWYLGIDLGTTGISAVLLNRSTAEMYPLYWSAQNQPEAISNTKAFRLPAEVYLPPTAYSGHHVEAETKQAQEQANASNAPAVTQNLFSAQLKPYLHIALPYKNERQKWEPVLQFNEVAMIPLVWVTRSLSKLLLTLKSDRNSTTLGLIASAAGLDQQIFHDAINNLAGVICTCPWNWTEQYRFNIREALLISKIVQHPQQVFFVEETIACLLSELDGANGETVKLSESPVPHAAKISDRPLVGNTLVINIGVSATEMALVDLPENLEDLTHDNFMLHGFAYAAKGIEQDIICQLLLSTKWRELISPNQGNSNATSGNAWNWQPAVYGVEQMSFADLGLESLNLPRPGEPDIGDRIRLQQRLESSLLGKAVLDAAIALKLILQHQESFSMELSDQRWNLQRRDLESHVFVPFVRRLNRELNKLLVAKGIPTEAVQQAILTGGTANLGAVSRWLRQKLPNARIIQDAYMDENGSPICSRVAYGLAMLPLHPQVLEVPKQQYTDYFLFTELLRLIPERALSLNDVIELFETRGINTRTCQQRLLAFLEGELPPGFLPNGTAYNWLAQISRENLDYKAIAEAPLFEKQGNFIYRPNSTQLQSLRRYLDIIKASTQQSLEEPYTVNFALGVVR
ncbi:hypothetical protein [Chlorogloeopsis sp. ULAP02]|uniref:hypothetical protein n=1 Tax=Chlorogloeopsis sp. ULAP02 TaxID=3107926 RepID=UPI003136CD27